MGTSKSSQVSGPRIDAGRKANIANRTGPFVVHASEHVVIESNVEVFVVSAVRTRPVVLNGEMLFADHYRVSSAIGNLRKANFASNVTDSRVGKRCRSGPSRASAIKLIRELVTRVDRVIRLCTQSNRRR